MVTQATNIFHEILEGNVSPFGALVSIRRDQKFKSHFINTATDREHLIRACKAFTFGTNQIIKLVPTSTHSRQTLSQSTSSTQNSNVNVSRLLTFCVQRHKINIQTQCDRAVNTIRVLALSKGGSGRGISKG